MSNINRDFNFLYDDVKYTNINNDEKYIELNRHIDQVKKRKKKEIINTYNKTFFINPDDPDDDIIGGSWSNIVHTFTLGDLTYINLEKISMKFQKYGSHHNPKTFEALFFYLSPRFGEFKEIVTENYDIFNFDELDPELLKNLHHTTTVLLFSRASAVITGALSCGYAHYVASKFIYFLNKRCNFKTCLRNFRIKNIVGTFNLSFKINLDKFSKIKNIKNEIYYKPSRFPMAIIRISDDENQNRKCALISFNGNIIITGCKKKKEALMFLKHLHPFLKQCKTRSNINYKEEFINEQKTIVDGLHEVIYNSSVKMENHLENDEINFVIDLISGKRVNVDHNNNFLQITNNNNNNNELIEGDPIEEDVYNRLYTLQILDEMKNILE